jgi:hypothetical protein
MAKSPKATQEAATQERPTDDQGHVLDEHGLPLSGPVRAAWLADAGMEDPALAQSEVKDEQPLPPLVDSEI